MVCIDSTFIMISLENIKDMSLEGEDIRQTYYLFLKYQTLSGLISTTNKERSCKSAKISRKNC